MSLHSCGSVYEPIRYFIKIGVDISNLRQVSARNVETKKLKKELGDKMPFPDSGFDIQRILLLGTPREMVQEVHYIHIAQGYIKEERR